jgi:aminobenzoyl-glutamate utilization protein B
LLRIDLENRPRALQGTLLLLALGACQVARAADDNVLEYVDGQAAAARSLAQDIWQMPELGYLEENSSARLQGFLKQRGFTVHAGAADIPTAFVASAGSGEPVIGILAEFDALPGLSQAAVAVRQPLQENGAGHACGHHLFGAASATAGVAVAQWLQAQGRSGTVRVYGTPAEEGGSGKVYLTRAGLFDDVDIMLHWHPSDRNDASPASSTANKSGRFTFHGIASHAAAAPDRGRSALDGVEAMNFMVNLMRVHVPGESRFLDGITEGGEAPSSVAGRARV